MLGTTVFTQKTNRETCVGHGVGHGEAQICGLAVAAKKARENLLNCRIVTSRGFQRNVLREAWEQTGFLLHGIYTLNSIIMKASFIPPLLLLPSLADAADGIRALGGKVYELPMWSKRALAHTFTAVTFGGAMAVSHDSERDSFMKRFGVDLQGDPILKKKYDDAVHSIGTSALAISAATFLSLSGVDKYSLTALVLAARYTDFYVSGRDDVLFRERSWRDCGSVLDQMVWGNLVPDNFTILCGRLFCEILANLFLREYSNNWTFMPFLMAYAALMPSAEVTVVEEFWFNQALAFFSGLSMVQGLVRLKYGSFE
jgi:hypothetical protein